MRIEVLGESREGRPIAALCVGTGPATVAIIGGIHGGSEANTVVVVLELLASFAAHPDTIPEGLSLAFVPFANPDGLEHGTRVLATGVDLNRNWPTRDWAPDTFDDQGRRSGGGGPGPLSEPETQVLAEWVERIRPVVVLAYHSAAGMVTGGPAASSLGLAAAYSQGSDYPELPWTAYVVTGDFLQWCEEQGYPAIDVELPDHASTEIERNVRGLSALLAVLSSE